MIVLREDLVDDRRTGGRFMQSFHTLQSFYDEQFHSVRLNLVVPGEAAERNTKLQ